MEPQVATGEPQVAAIRLEAEPEVEPTDQHEEGRPLVPAGGDKQKHAQDRKQKQKQIGAKRRPFFNPSDAFCHWWSAVVSLAFLYNFWSLSYRFAFREIDDSTVTIWFIFDYTADLIYLNDIYINFRTGYLEDGVLQREPKKIGAHYRESTLFYLDMLCLLPFDFLYLSFSYWSILRCNKLVKIYKFWSFVDRTERHTNYPNVFRTFTLVHYILVIFHWNACLFHMISKHNVIDIATLYKINDNQCDDILCQYLHAFYWSTLALTLIGDLPRPRTHGEYIYVIVELCFGLFLFASVLGHVANIVTNVSAARKEFQAKLDAVKTFMRTRHVSDDLQNKVIRWFDYLWYSQKSSDEERSVACLPDRLKAEIAIHVNLDTLKRVDIFQNTEAGFLCELVLRLKPVLFSPGDYVCRKNEVGHEMYIVSRGILEVVTDDGQTVVATFRAGSYFGEIAVLNVGTAGNKRTASVRSVGYSDLFCLSKRDLWDVLKDYPNAAARIRAVAEERLSKLSGNQASNTAGAATIKRRSSDKTMRTRKVPASNRRSELVAGVADSIGSHRRRVCSSDSCYYRPARVVPPSDFHHACRAAPIVDYHCSHCTCVSRHEPRETSGPDIWLAPATPQLAPNTNTRRSFTAGRREPHQQQQQQQQQRPIFQPTSPLSNHEQERLLFPHSSSARNFLPAAGQLLSNSRSTPNEYEQQHPTPLHELGHHQLAQLTPLTRRSSVRRRQVKAAPSNCHRPLSSGGASVSSPSSTLSGRDGVKSAAGQQATSVASQPDACQRFWPHEEQHRQQVCSRHSSPLSQMANEREMGSHFEQEAAAAHLASNSIQMDAEQQAAGAPTSSPNFGSIEPRQPAGDCRIEMLDTMSSSGSSSSSSSGTSITSPESQPQVGQQ